MLALFVRLTMGVTVLPSTQPVATVGSSFVLSSFELIWLAHVGLVEPRLP